MIQDNIYTYLSGITDLTTLLDGDSIKWPAADINKLNGISYKIVSDPNLYGSDRKFSLYRFVVNNSKATTCQAIAEVLTRNLHEFCGDMAGLYINYIFQESDLDPYLLADGSTFQIIQQYRFTII